jgi:RND family efflux transporter MFP subunit
LTQAALVAPISGLVAKRHVVAGEKLAIEQPVLTIVDLERLELAASVGTHEVSQLTPGMPVRVTIEGVPQPVNSTIDRIAPAAEAGTRSIGVVVLVPNPRERLRAGQYAVAQVELPDSALRLTVATSAVQQGAGQDYVWAIDNGALAQRAVTLGRRDSARGRVEVTSGLSEGQVVLAARFDNLRPGAAARVVGAPAAPLVAGSASAVGR